MSAREIRLIESIVASAFKDAHLVLPHTAVPPPSAIRVAVGYAVGVMWCRILDNVASDKATAKEKFIEKNNLVHKAMMGLLRTPDHDILSLYGVK